MQHYTTIEQSKKLVELGLSPDTADMYYFCDPTPVGNIMYPTLIIVEKHLHSRLPEYNKGDIPCWSLGALLEVMPYRTEMSRKVPYSKIMRRDTWDGDFCFICYPKGLEENKYISGYHNNPLDAAFEMVCWLLENNYIKKGE